MWNSSPGTCCYILVLLVLRSKHQHYMVYFFLLDSKTLLRTIPMATFDVSIFLMTQLEQLFESLPGGYFCPKWGLQLYSKPFYYFPGEMESQSISSPLMMFFTIFIPNVHFRNCLTIGAWSRPDLVQRYLISNTVKLL